jgi:sugar diacid utilization regulator
MVTVADVFAAPGVRPHLEILAGDPAASTASSVTLLEGPSELAGAAEGTVAVFTGHASAPAATYRFDIALRVARNRGVAAVVVSGGSFSAITSTAASIAQRSRITVARAKLGTDLAQLCVRITHEILGPSEVALERAQVSLDAILDHRQSTISELVDVTAQELGLPVALHAEPAEGQVCVPIEVDGEIDRWICCDAPPTRMASAAKLICHVLAAEVARRDRAERQAVDAPIRSRAELLSELLGRGSQGSTQLVRRARALDIPVDGWHVAVQLDVDCEEHQADRDEMAAFETRQAIARVALETARSDGSEWHSARIGPSIVLIRTYRDDPGTTGVTNVVRTAERLLKRIEPRLGDAVARCGVGSLHSGPTGLVSTVAEARAAVAAARATGHVNVATVFDSMGLRRTVLEWYASDSARDAVTQILAPLDQLEGRRAATALRTLQTYLDSRGSLAETARVLNLHRNAVSYRIRKIFSLLDADPDRPDDWLLLQLACRARNLR